MKRWVTISIVIGVVALLAGGALAQMGWGPGYGMGPGQYPCPGAQAGASGSTPVTEESAKQIAQQYADRYLKGYRVDAVLPFTNMGGWTAYSVELHGPKDELRILHVNPWGGVMPFGGPGRRAG